MSPNKVKMDRKKETGQEALALAVSKQKSSIFWPFPLGPLDQSQIKIN